MSRTIIQGTRSPSQSLERSRGLAAPLDPARHYRVEPGEDAPEYWPKPGQSTLAGLEDAITRAAWLSMARPPQRVVRVELARTEPEKIIRWYRGGNQLAVAS